MIFLIALCRKDRRKKSWTWNVLVLDKWLVHLWLLLVSDLASCLKWNPYPSFSEQLSLRTWVIRLTSSYLRTEEATAFWRTFFRSRVQPICCVMTAGWCLIQVWLATLFSACPMNFAWDNELFVWSAARSPTISDQGEHDLSEQWVNGESRTESFNVTLVKNVSDRLLLRKDQRNKCFNEWLRCD